MITQPVRHLGRNVGLIKKGRFFLTYRKPKHYFQKFGGYGLSYAVLKKLRSAGIDKLVFLIESPNQECKKYEASVESFLKHGIIYHDKRDSQRILGMQHFKKAE